MDLSAFPTPRPALNVIILVSSSLCILLLLRQLLKGLVYWIRQEHAFWGVPADPLASLLYGHAPLVSSFACDDPMGQEEIYHSCSKRFNVRYELSKLGDL